MTGGPCAILEPGGTFAPLFLISLEIHGNPWGSCAFRAHPVDLRIYRWAYNRNWTNQRRL